jgi:hypothetical protein
MLERPCVSPKHISSFGNRQVSPMQGQRQGSLRPMINALLTRRKPPSLGHPKVFGMTSPLIELARGGALAGGGAENR